MGKIKSFNSFRIRRLSRQDDDADRPSAPVGDYPERKQDEQRMVHTAGQDKDPPGHLGSVEGLASDWIRQKV